MKTKIFSLAILSVLSLVMLVSLTSATTLANWDFNDSNLVVDSGTGTLTISDSRTPTYPAGNAPSATVGMSTTEWDTANRYIELDVSTSGYEDIIIKFDSQASSTGPTAFQIQYSADGTTFTNFGSATSTVSAFTTNPMHTFNFSSITTIDNNANTEFRIAVPTAASGSTGTFRLDNILIEGTAVTTTSTTDIPSDITACTTTGNPGNDLSVKIKDITVTSGFGDDDNFWYPLDEIEVEIEVENNGNDDIDNIEVEWGLYDVDDDNFIIDDKENDFNVKDGKDNTIYINFKLEDPNDFQNNDYVFYVWANGEVDNASNTEVCDSDSQDIDITNDDNFVVLDDINFPSTASCGTEVQITADVWNVGDSDQDEVKVVLFNSDLGINKIVEIGDINDFDNEILDTFVEIPSDVEAKAYSISLKVYDEDSDIYETDEDNDESKYSIRLNVENCAGSSSTALVSANLESGGKAGEELVVKATIVNSGTKTATYIVNAASYSGWADSASVDQSTFTLAAGASKEVMFTFDVNEDASGEKQFNIEVISGNQLVTTQPVQIEIQGTSPGITGITGNVFAENKYLWGIGILNVILIVFIIIVAIRVARK